MRIPSLLGGHIRACDIRKCNDGGGIRSFSFGYSFAPIRSGMWAAFLDRDQNSEADMPVRKIGIGDALYMKG
jgi:hypothetical protein